MGFTNAFFIRLIHVPFVERGLIERVPSTHQTVGQIRRFHVQDIGRGNAQQAGNRGHRHDARGRGTMMPFAGTAREGVLQKLRNAQIPGQDTEHGQHHQWRRHDEGLFMDVVRVHADQRETLPRTPRTPTGNCKTRSNRGQDTQHRENLAQRSGVPRSPATRRLY